MANIPVFKILALVLLVFVVGCKTVFPNFPMFYSHQDLLDQEREIDNSFNRSK